MRRTASVVLSAVVLLALPGVASAGTPQQVTYNTAKILHRAPFIHGPNMTVVITDRYSTGDPTQIGLDCAGDAFGRVPTYRIERYGRKNIELFTCQNLTNKPSLSLAIPGPVTKTLYHNLKRRAMRYACRSLQRTGRRHKKGRNRAVFSCAHLRGVDSTSGRTVLRFHINSRSDVRKVVLTSDARMIISRGDGFRKTFHNRRF
jgi:hypothetical protein